MPQQSKPRTILNRPIGYGLVGSALLLTALLTGIFWKIGSEDVLEQQQRQDAVREIRLIDAALDREIEAMRSFHFKDSSQMLLLSSLLDASITNVGILASEEVPSRLHGNFEQLANILVQKRGLVHGIYRDRVSLGFRIARFRQDLMHRMQSPAGASKWLGVLDSTGMMLAGTDLQIQTGIRPPETDPVRIEFAEIRTEYDRQQSLLRKINTLHASTVSEEIASVYQTRAMEASSERHWMHQAFYAMSMLLLLVTITLFARIRQNQS